MGDAGSYVENLLDGMEWRCDNASTPTEKSSDMSDIFESMKQEAEKAKSRGEEEVAYTIHVDGSFVTCVIRVSEIDDDQNV